MTLRFPHARLFIHNLLADGRISGGQAIALSACEFGLLDSTDMHSLAQSHGSPSCDCKNAARSVLLSYFQESSKAAAVCTDKIWSALENEARRYEQPSNTPVTCHDCNRFAPVLFDLMLQEIHRHPYISKVKVLPSPAVLSQ